MFTFFWAFDSKVRSLPGLGEIGAASKFKGITEIIGV
jgi:hypothetical protein